MLVVIDNYDSFTYNLVQLLRELGKEVMVFRNDTIALEQLENLQPEGLIISPGPGRPEDAGICLEAVKGLAGKIPILGVCLGHQTIAQAFGGKIVGAASLMHGKTSKIIHDGLGLYNSVPQEFQAARYHSLAVEEGSLPAALRFLPEQWKGGDGIKAQGISRGGVQFHPESIATPEGKKLLGNFISLIN
ncbi:hypothetical protein N752_27645 [Desulforamulus aquiferis]|nr:aminodeoxychorismate/anthranilate synthase component II [Desulforamulus aquiferis]RYD01902.1 hypothetical protein N752_27645 [Desulforamulus aquiferis]